MTIARRRFLRLVASAASLPALTHTAEALDYPTRPISSCCRFRRVAYSTSLAGRGG